MNALAKIRSDQFRRYDTKAPVKWRRDCQMVFVFASKGSRSSNIMNYMTDEVANVVFSSPPVESQTQNWSVVVSPSARFEFLANEWKKEVGLSSSSTEIALRPSYQAIIGMGKDALPFIFKKLQQEGDKPNNWFWALRAITGQEPIPKTLRGNRREIAKRWLLWGEQQGYVERHG